MNQAYVPPQGSRPTPLVVNWRLNGIGRERNCTIERIREMSRRFRNTYTGYSIGCAIVWALILAGISLGADGATRHKFPYLEDKVEYPVLMALGMWWPSFLAPGRAGTAIRNQAGGREKGRAIAARAVVLAR